MDVFEFRDRLVGDYRDFTRSFIQPSAGDIRAFLDQEKEIAEFGEYRTQRRVLEAFDTL